MFHFFIIFPGIRGVGMLNKTFFLIQTINLRRGKTWQFYMKFNKAAINEP